MRRVVALSLAGALLALAVGCGAPTDDQPRALSAVPADLLAANPVTTTVTSPPGSTSQVAVYFFGAERLVQVQRLVEYPATVEKLVRQLFSGPREDEIRRGLRSLVNHGTTVLSASTDAGIATIDLNGAPAEGDGIEEVTMALAQIVYTATSLAGVIGVQFTRNGQKLSVPTSDGSKTFTPVGKASYAPRYAPL